MFTKEDILARLRNGEDAQTIADEIAQGLNEAINQVKEEQDQKKAEQMKKEAQEAELDEIAEDIADAIMDYMCVQDPSLTDVFAKDPIEPSYVRQALDVSQPIMGLIKSLSGPVEKDKNSKTIEKVYTGDEAKRIADKVEKMFGEDSISKFLRTYGLL
jgi:phage FluMu gp28-like protein